MSRDNFLMVVSAAQNHGKSDKTFRDILYMAYGAPIPQRRKTLIVDANGEYGDKEVAGQKHRIKEIKKKDILAYGQFKGGDVKRVTLTDDRGFPLDDEESATLIIYCLNYFRNGTVLLEDMAKIFGDSLPQGLTKTIINVRHKGIDIIVHQQSIARCVPKILQNAKEVRFHFQIDPIVQAASKLKGEEEIFYIAEKLVGNEHAKCHCPEGRCSCGYRYFYVYINRVTKKIKGAFSKTMFTNAIMQYLQENPSKFKNIMNTRSLSGDKVYDFNGALMEKTRQLFFLYYGNPAEL